MKRIVVCCDGTWNRRDQKRPTNVAKIAAAVVTAPPDGIKQCLYYHDGVGTLSWVDKLPGGVFGAGLWRNVQEAYRYVVENYESGDDLYLFGFSRGAYTVRSLAGLIRKCGILLPEARGHIDEAYNLYRDGRIPVGKGKAQDFRSKYAVVDEYGDVPPIKFVGVWDTVGALGVPLGVLGWLFNRKHRFHDVALSRTVSNGYHAVAINEKRGPFQPTLWEQHPDAIGQTLEQRWFAGVHTNIGGGDEDARQSDRTLLWMMSKARRHGLVLDVDYISTQVVDKLDGTLSRSLFHEIARIVPFNLMTYVRPIGEGVPVEKATYLGGLSNEAADPAVNDRNVDDSDYMPTNLVAYYRKRPEKLVEAKQASRSVWPDA